MNFKTPIFLTNKWRSSSVFHQDIQYIWGQIPVKEYLRKQYSKPNQEHFEATMARDTDSEYDTKLKSGKTEGRI